MIKPGFFIPRDYANAVDFIQRHLGSVQIIAGGTDLIPHWREKGFSDNTQFIIDISSLRENNEVVIRSGCRTSVEGNTIHTVLARNPYLWREATVLAQAAESIGALQTRNRGTIAGNIVNASPAGDLLAPLVVLDASVHLQSKEGERVVPISEFLQGPGQVDLYDGEVVKKVSWGELPPGTKSLYVKLGRRSALSIARIGVAVALKTDISGKVDYCRVALAATFPVARRLERVEDYLLGKEINGETLAETALLVERELREAMGARPSASYKVPVGGNLVSQALKQVLQEDILYPLIPESEVVQANAQQEVLVGPSEKMQLECIINNQPFSMALEPSQRLVDVLRQEFGLSGCKEGCGVGECGSCTIIMNGRTVNACLVLVGQAHGTNIITPEGLNNEPLYIQLQEAFLRHGAVQCGYCTPGMLISCYDLLVHRSTPEPGEVRKAIAGNLCRCGGYQQIVDAVIEVAHSIRI